MPVTHSISKEFTAQLKKDGLTAYVGPDNGYVLTFSNGLVVYMSGDSGINRRSGCHGTRVLWRVNCDHEYRRPLHVRAQGIRLFGQQADQAEGGHPIAYQ